ncbi:DNA-binding response regulator [Paenibacillus rigui]|uniref:DNA-binding response regulator n=2 Tax=Paenibacillus rigui TaxID=554312 RepID=A0A229UT90_9BACL|nr:DNA-binding response regulator [Paenibacillus rigui]
MKAIIVDDEKHVREAIKLLVPWDEFHIEEILEAQDGQEAIETILEERPQIIFTDMMMPLVGGMELLEWLQTNYPSGKTIVISGFDDFQLVRHTVQHGGVDYILKPIDAEQLHAAVTKAVDCWNREETERQGQTQRNIEMNQIRPVYWDKLLSNLINEPTGYEAAASALAKEFGIGPHIQECQLAIVNMHTLSGKLKEKFRTDQDLLFFSITNICNEFLREPRQGVAYRYWNSDNEIILLLFGPALPGYKLVASIQEGIEATLRSRMDIGISSILPFPAGLPEAYGQARTALRRRNLLTAGKEVHIYQEKPPANPLLLSFSDYAEPIRLAVRSGSPEQIHRSVLLWFEAVNKLESITQEQLELWWNEYRLQRSRWLLEWFGDQANELNAMTEPSSFMIPFEESGTLSIPLWQQQMDADLTGLSQLMLKHQHQDNNVIFEIAKYIQNHYHQDITLQEIANHFYLSREYISRKFKQEFKVNLSDYLSSIRAEKAKLLLLNPHLRIAQVAEMVGYDDEKYFSKVFKKIVGFSPNEYRKVNQP